MSPASVENQTAKIETDKDIKLVARGRNLVFDGFLKLDPDAEERFIPLPKMKTGDSPKFKKADQTQHFTEPPARYSEASLVKELEKLGIGRPSTYAPIMSTIVDRGYVTKNAARFTPEDVAFVVIDLLKENFSDIVDYDFTAKMEEDLDDIAEGDKQLVPVLKEFYEPFAKNLKEKEKTIDKSELTEEKTDKKCPDCKKPLIIKLGRFGKFYACSGYPDCKYKAPILDEESKKQQKQVEKELEEPCPTCGKPLQMKQSRFGNFIGCSGYPDCKFTRSIVISAEAKCPNCGKDINRRTTRRGKVFWGCSGYPKCKTAFWDEPVAKKCPKCDNLLLKKKAGLSCSQCDYVEETPATAES